MGLSVLGLQQASHVGLGRPGDLGCIAAGLLLLVAFVLVELRTEHPLIQVRIFKDRAFMVENVVLFITMIVFVPVFFFASMYSQIVARRSAPRSRPLPADLLRRVRAASQIGGRMLDNTGPSRRSSSGCAVARRRLRPVGLERSPTSTSTTSGTSSSSRAPGMGLMLGPANTDAINRAPATSYGEATGVTQTVRNYGSSLGMAVLGTILIAQNKLHIETRWPGSASPRPRPTRSRTRCRSRWEGTRPTLPARPARSRRSSRPYSSISPRRWRSSSTEWRARWRSPSSWRW